MKNNGHKKTGVLARKAKRPSKPSYEVAVRKRLSKVKEVDAAFVSTDEAGTVHVSSVVQEFGPFFDRLMRQERLIERDCPDISFDFHVRARQNRELSRVVPCDAQLVFAR